MTKTAILSAVVLLSATAAAASNSSNQRPDLAVSITPPANVTVYQTVGYNVRVRNIGSRDATGVLLVIDLPQTGTSPSVYVMGNLGAFSTPACTRSNTRLTCSLGTIAKNNGSNSVFFDLALPYSTAPLVFSASATTTANPGDNTPANNSLTYTAVPRTVSFTMSTAVTATNRHCTGQPVLSSFFECRLFPSSISSHQTIFNSDGTIAFIGAPASYTGTWTYTPSQNRLQFQYFNGGDLVATFDGRGVGAKCVEGKTTFTPDNGYVSLYEVCFP